MNHSHDATIRTLIRQAARWSIAADQDENAMVAIMHANYGAGYLWALNDIATTSEIENITGINYRKFRDEIVRIQDSATKKMIDVCPDYAPSGYLVTIGK